MTCRTSRTRSRRPDRGARTNDVRFVLSLLVLANVVMAAEVPLAMPPVGPAPGYRTRVAAASNGRGFLVVSREWRQRPTLCGMRADESGRLLDPVMFTISADEPGDDPIGVASDGDSYLATWNAGGFAHFARIDDRGNVTPGGAIANSHNLSLAWGGSAYVVGYLDGASLPTFAVVASDGTVLRSGIRIVTGAAYPYYLRVSPAATGTVLATWLGIDQRVHAVVAHTRALSDGSYATPVSDEENEPAPFDPIASQAVAANNGRETLVVWVESAFSAPPVRIINSFVRARRLDANGFPAGDAFTVANVYPDGRSSVQFAVAWNGSAFVIAYAGESDDRGTLLAVWADDHVTTLREVEELPRSHRLLALAGSNHGALFVWNTDQLYGTFVDTAAHVTRLFSRASASQSQPKIAWCGDAYRAVWLEQSNRSRILFGRVGVDGMPLDGDGIVIVDSASSKVAPAIACNASNALIIWKEFGFQYPLIRAARVDADGTVHPPVTLGETFGRGHSVVWNGSEYLAAWQGPSRVALFRIAAGGEPISSALKLLSFEATNGGSIALAWNGSQYLIAWNVQTWVRSTVNAAVLSAGIEPVVSRTVSLPAGVDALDPIAVAGNGSWLVAWSEGSSGEFVTLNPFLGELERGTIDETPADGSFTGNNYRLVTGDDAIAHDASVAAVIHSRLTDERSTRLYVSIDSGRLRSARH